MEPLEIEQKEQIEPEEVEAITPVTQEDPTTSSEVAD